MSTLASVVTIVSALLNLYLLILLVRVVLDWIQLFVRQWRPTGAILILANVVYALTDPPLRWLRRVVPVLRLGAMGIDLSFLVLWLGIIVLQRVLALLV
ncbi:MAG: YggT family protein [Actinomyces sp.]|uniref:YggT family protein n=1 Tax=Actinomyces sp. TaxID=29317 RepID=UPI0026DD2A49|nr:YggT family protein [Actinomyces sp.]MDO4243904.1 YggT family protein [Actinomyces sp.]